MAHPVPIRPTADAVLTAFFSAQRSRVGGRRRRRVAEAEADLRRCFEQEAHRLLTEPEQHLLTGLRRSEPDGAAARVAEPDAVLLALPVFLDEVAWHGAEPEDRRIRAHLALALMRTLLRRLAGGEGRAGCEVWSVEAAIERSLAEVRTARPARAALRVADLLPDGGAETAGPVIAEVAPPLAPLAAAHGRRGTGAS